MAKQTLAELEVLFKVGEIGPLEFALAKVDHQLQGIEASAVAMQSAVNRTFGLATATVTGFALAGFHASAMGEMFGIQMGELSRQIGSVFVPEFQLATRLVQDAVNWFRSLSGEQQRNVAHWIEFGLVTVAAANILPRLLAGYKSLAALWQVMFAAGIAEAGVFKGVLMGLLPFGLVPSLLALVAAFGLFTNTGGMREAFGGLLSSVMKLAESLAKLFTPFVNALVSLLSGAAGLLAPVIEALAWIVDKIAKLVATVAKLAPGQEEEGNTFDNAIYSLTDWLNAHIPELDETHYADTDWRRKQADGERKKDQRTDLTPRLGGFTSLEGAWQRLAESSIKATAGGKPVDEEQLAVQTRIRQLIEQGVLEIQRGQAVVGVK